MDQTLWRVSPVYELALRASSLMDQKKPTLTLYELTHISMLLPDPKEHSEDEYQLSYRYDIEHTAVLTFIRANLSGRFTWLFTGNVLLPPLYSVELT